MWRLLRVFLKRQEAEETTTVLCSGALGGSCRDKTCDVCYLLSMCQSGSTVRPGDTWRGHSASNQEDARISLMNWQGIVNKLNANSRKVNIIKSVGIGESVNPL